MNAPHPTPTAQFMTNSQAAEFLKLSPKTLDRYRFFLRPHLLEVWDLVCYAVPAERLRH